MRNEFPALNANGYVDKDGKDHELSENNKYTKLITQYQYLQYNSLMDTETCKYMTFCRNANTKNGKYVNQSFGHSALTECLKRYRMKVVVCVFKIIRHTINNIRKSQSN